MDRDSPNVQWLVDQANTDTLWYEMPISNLSHDGVPANLIVVALRSTFVAPQPHWVLIAARYSGWNYGDTVQYIK